MLGAMANDQLRLEDFLPYRLNRLADAVSRDFSALYRAEYGLTRPEWRILATLGEIPKMTATAIGAHSAMHKTKVSRAVAALEKRRWLKRSAEESDKRVEHLSLTAAGRQAYARLVPIAKAFETKLLAQIPARQRGDVLQALRLLESAVSPSRK